jgi:hypothetical protein
MKNAFLAIGSKETSRKKEYVYERHSETVNITQRCPKILENMYVDSYRQVFQETGIHL